MKIFNHILGFPRIGSNRELKKAQEDYWSGKITRNELLLVGKRLRKENWKQQKKYGIDFLPVGDFAWYDHVLSTSMLLGNIPDRHKNIDSSIDIDTMFRIARGSAPKGKPVFASEMTKWFNTNYHYIVPEFCRNQEFSYSWNQLLEEVDEALLLGYKIKPILLGPLTYLWLGKIKGDYFNKIDLLHKMLPIYNYVLKELSNRGIKWVQIDEPILGLELPNKWKEGFKFAYRYLGNNKNLLLTTYFEDIHLNLETIVQLPVSGIHIDLLSGKYNLSELNLNIPKDWLLSLGIINGRNVWKTDLVYWFDKIRPIINKRKNIWIGSSCSLLHSPIDLNLEKNLNQEIKNWFSFALQKCFELSMFTQALNNDDKKDIKDWSNFIHIRNNSKLVHNRKVQNRLKKFNFQNLDRKSSYSVRFDQQKRKLKLPILPTTTIGSFPQTKDIRKVRRDFKNGLLSIEDYNKHIEDNIKKVILEQESLGLDVLVHGEVERNDMVEYFGENLNGFVFTDYGWVQSYGSRCVKPPIIIGDIYRSKNITVKWSKYAQSLTNKLVKGMLTGPITILCWSFIREDISKELIAKQIGLALRDEVLDLESSGIKIIQIDEPALREGLPLREKDWDNYLFWAVQAFKLTCFGVKNTTQIHTHMCYCEFEDIMNAIVKLDADVITIETSRSDMQLLEFFKNFKYPNGIGPGVYDIHSPNVPEIENIKNLLNKALTYISKENLWVNPDCGLKTRTWIETRRALKNMVIATKQIRLNVGAS
ncbi:5-methyltetrahydropteroyltriglutamate--homocysteine S-methyltransferase [Buchnera aphidicola (Mindarus keteleerifoliae)]|uniref:5-methyltetrahydropteroyltriglutamate-- homocysteine S-methyltransferase n=1 Tax=Buchnera aphidicola TaxID=9 RepID=UPI0031B6BA11